MFPDVKSIKCESSQCPSNLLSAKFKQSIIQQAATSLLQYVRLNDKYYRKAQNTNGNAIDDCFPSWSQVRRSKTDSRRTDKCNSWLSEFPRNSDTSLNRYPTFLKPPFYKQSSHHYLPPVYKYSPKHYSTSSMNQSYHSPLTYDLYPCSPTNHLIENINGDNNVPHETVFQPLILIHKKRVHHDNFLSTMQNCAKPPYSQNHFYAFDQSNMLKLQRRLGSMNHDKDNEHQKYDLTLKRKYFEIQDEDLSKSCFCCCCCCHRCCSDINNDKNISSKRHVPLSDEKDSPQLNELINTANDESKLETISKEKSDKNSNFENQTIEQTNILVTNLEKILHLCGELRSMAKDIENCSNEQQTISKTTATSSFARNPIETCDREETTIDICKELEFPTTGENIHPTDSSEPHLLTNDTSSVHLASSDSHQLMQTASFKIQSSSIVPPHTKIRKSEEICSCFLKSVFNTENCSLNMDEQEYLNELTKAYILGQQQARKEQQKTNENVRALSNSSMLLEKPHELADTSALISDTTTNNNSLSYEPISSSSFLFYNSTEKLDLHPLPTTVTNENEQHVPIEITNTKHEAFINEPIAMKKTNVLPGIGVRYAQHLDECGFSTARRLLGFYLMIKDDQQFVSWLNNKVGISTHSAWLCTNTLRAWCDAHL